MIDVVEDYYIVYSSRRDRIRKSKHAMLRGICTVGQEAMEAADEFKRIEKMVKQVYKQKKQTTDFTSVSACQRMWNDLVVDVLKPNSRVHEVVQPSSSSSASSSSSRKFKISGVADGFFFISRGLTLDEQLQWARIALEEYSTAEHTNLENLKRLKEANCIFPKVITEHQKQRLAELFATTRLKSRVGDEVEPQDQDDGNRGDNSLWRRSVLECNGLKSFQSLRWASLGKTEFSKKKYVINLIMSLNNYHYIFQVIITIGHLAGIIEMSRVHFPLISLNSHKDSLVLSFVMTIIHQKLQ